MQNKIVEMYNKRPKLWIVKLLLTFIILFIIVLSSNGIEFKGITEKGSEVALGIFHGLLHPDQSYLFSTGVDKVPYLILQTISIAILGTIFGAIIALPFSFLSSPKIVGKYIAKIFTSIVLLIRTIPALVWALVWIRVTGPGPFCGVVTQTICSIGMITKMYVTAIEDLDTGVLESLDACGLNGIQKIRYGIIPQLSASFISTTIYRFDINLKDATTLGIVGAGGIGAPLIQAIDGRRWSIVGAFLSGLILLVLIIEYFSTKIRTKLARGN
ncbi:MAG: ABC transporter permease subunit [Erysipelotrichaceae bacterium]|nr:ABC transporter permease subunit [Erysipelotrichaceae bacterium]